MSITRRRLLSSDGVDESPRQRRGSTRSSHDDDTDISLAVTVAVAVAVVVESPSEDCVVVAQVVTPL
jgi:hypothetical protein